MEAKGITLTKIIGEEKDYKKEIRKELNFIDINRYVIELIRVSEMYKFQVKIRPKNRKLKEEKKAEIKESIEEKAIGAVREEEKQEINHYIAIKETFNEENITYLDNRIKIKGREYKYGMEKPDAKYQELWEKTGFYQEKTTQARVRVQLWPEHNFYDHFKRKRAFLFC